MPKSNRGIFAINELPDLAERIQVGLLNVLEERDVQIRGQLVRLDLDVLVVATANPEDYTNRGRLITPLKDRFGSQIRTHYPPTVEIEVGIMRQEARLPEVPGSLEIPWFIEDIVARVSHLARSSNVINQRSGVSVRLSIANYETVVANAVRRSLRSGELHVVPRVSDLTAVVQSTQGKVELDVVDDTPIENLIASLVGLAVRQSFAENVVLAEVAEILAAFESGAAVNVGEDVRNEDYSSIAALIPDLNGPITRLVGEDASAGMRASAIEFILEGLYVTKRLGKDSSGARALYRARHR